jgi:hypothetical protein
VTGSVAEEASSPGELAVRRIRRELLTFCATWLVTAPITFVAMAAVIAIRMDHPELIAATLVHRLPLLVAVAAPQLIGLVLVAWPSRRMVEWSVRRIDARIAQRPSATKPRRRIAPWLSATAWFAFGVTVASVFPLGLARRLAALDAPPSANRQR